MDYNNFIRRGALLFDCTYDEVIGDSREYHIVRARHAMMYALKAFTGCTLKEIARLFNRDDHSTVINAKRRIENALEKDYQLVDKMMYLREIIDDEECGYMVAGIGYEWVVDFSFKLA